MGAAATFGRLLNGVTTGIQQKVDEQHDKEEARKKELRDFYLKSLSSPDVNEAGREEAQQQYLKLLNPEAKKGFSRILPALGQIVGHVAQAQQPGQQPAQQGPTPAPAAQAPPPGSAAVGATPPFQAETPAPTPKETFAAGPKFTGTPGNIYPNADQIAARKLKQEQDEYNIWLDRGRQILGKDANPRDLAEYAGSRGTRLPAQTKRIADKGVARPGEDPTTGKPYEGLWDHTVDKDGEESWAKRPDKVPAGSGSIRSVPHAVSVVDAKALAKNGATYKDGDGNDIDLDKLPPNMGLQAMVRGDKLFYVPISPNQKEITVGNVKYAATPWELSSIPQGGGTQLGVARVGSSGTSQQIAEDPVTHQLVINTLTRTSTPQVPGAVGRPAAAPIPAGKQPISVAQPGGAPAPAPAPGIRGLPSGVAEKARQMAIPVTEAATQLFGDPSQPDFKGLMDYSDMAGNKESQQRIGTALNLIFGQMDEATGGGGAHIAADAGPISVSTGGIGTLLQNYFGVPTEIAKQKSQIMSDAMGKLTPEERQYVNAAVSSLSSVIGLRSLTRASAAQSTVKALERDIPLIGVNVFSKDDFLDKGQKLAELTYNGSKQLPNVNGRTILDPAMLKRIQGLPTELQKRKGGGPSKAPASKKSAASQDVVDDLVKKYSGAK